jgi:phosphoribosyl-dephospho-CoA transferase
MIMQARHNLAWLTPEGWQEARQSAPQDLHEALAEWERAAWPAIVRRQDVDAAPDQCSLGIPLPPGLGSDGTDGIVRKKRIALCVSRDRLAATASPLTLAETLPAAPVAWRAALAQLDQNASTAGLVLRVYGSLAMQAITGKQYLTASSDIDLLFAPASRKQLATGMKLLLDASTVLPLDGEVVFPDGHAVAWREWQAVANDIPGHKARVLAKQLHHLRLAKPETLLEAFDDALETSDAQS